MRTKKDAAEGDDVTRPFAERSAQDAERLVHELRVHQVELELQNQELERTRNDLERALSRYSELYDFAPVGYFTLGAAGELGELNLEGARQLGGTRAELVGRPIVRFLRSSSRVDFERFLIDMQDGKSSCVVEPLRFPGVCLRLKGERSAPGEGFRVVADDISELSRTETERARLALAVEQLDEAITITDTEGNVVFVNRAFERLTGIAGEEALGRPSQLLERGAHDPQTHEQLWATLRAGEVWHGQMNGRRSDGTHYTEDASISPLRNELGVVTHFVAVRRDITAQLSLEEQLQASRRMEAIGLLAGGVAHDFNNLLLVIQSSAEFLLEELPKDAPARVDVLAIQGAGQRAVTLTRQLLAFGRRQFLRPQVVDLEALTAGVAQMLRRVLRENVELRIEACPAPWRVFADPSQLEQAVVNLTLNAQDAMPEGGRLRFDLANVPADAWPDDAALEEAPPGEYVRLSVTDTGCGMSEDVRVHIFEPFFSTKKEKGTGLGLATVYGIVKQSGGFISCTSEPGQGTVFAIYFPRRAAASEPPPAPETNAPVAPRKRVKILVVEDEESVRKVTCRMLEAAGYEVLTASNGAEALSLCREHASSLALVLTDVVMPVMGGAELRRRLSEEFPGLEVVLMSGYPDDLPDTPLLAKPFDSATLLNKLHRRLAARS